MLTHSLFKSLILFLETQKQCWPEACLDTTNANDSYTMEQTLDCPGTVHRLNHSAMAAPSNS